MDRTRLSLYYPAGYLLTGGVGFLTAPSVMLELFGSTGEYGYVMVRFAGVLLIAIGILVVQLVRHRVEALYSTTLFVRGIILTAIGIFYIVYKDPMMLTLIAIIGCGFVLTTACLALDKRDAARKT